MFSMLQIRKSGKNHILHYHFFVKIPRKNIKILKKNYKPFIYAMTYITPKSTFIILYFYNFTKNFQQI